MLTLLARIARALTASGDLDHVLGPVLRTLSEEAGLARVTLSRVDRASHEVRIVAAHGLTPAEVARGRYGFGEGIIGRVVVDGTPRIVPSIESEPQFLDRTGARDAGVDRSFVCVPIRADDEVLGAISAYRPVTPALPLQTDVELLTVVAGLLAPAVRAAAGPSASAPPPARVEAPADMVGSSAEMQAVYQLVAQVADSTTTVLLRGESGTGKELVAGALHRGSPRRRGPFVKVNCAALPESIIESELFGHERGAFTGAHQQRKGRFELAQGGTLFLDEIGDLSPATQIKLLRVLQEREFERVGGNRTLQVDVRVIAATSRELERMIDEGTFRKDLYYRLAIFPIRLPPLRERRADILQLTDHFVELFNRAHGRDVRRISTPAIDMLVAYHWPGNVRELENCVERAVLLARDGVIHGHHLPPTLQTADATGTTAHTSLPDQLHALERSLILDALKSNRGNMAATARDLGITERQMGVRIDRYGIDPSRFKRIPT